MATVLEKDLVRESTEKFDDREIVVTLGVNQKIELKLKGLKKGGVSVGILELWNKLNGNSDAPKAEEPKKLNSIKRDDSVKNTDVMINLNDLRSQNAISTLDIATLCKFDGIIKGLIEDQKKKNDK